MKHRNHLSILSTVIFLTLFLFNSNCIIGNSINKVKTTGENNDTLTVTFRVNGNSACKTSIETALTSQAGVISAIWNTSTKQITVIFKSIQIKASDLHSYLAIAGYDTAELRAKQGVYDALPSNCKYTRDPESE
jgi:periplasmic mercuric ion binding protein